MKTIYKYPVKIVDEQQILIPEGSNIISVALDPNGSLCIWAEVDTKVHSFETITIHIVGTGNPILEWIQFADYVGSVTQNPFVWHIYKEKTRR